MLLWLSCRWFGNKHSAGDRHETIPGVYYCVNCGERGTLEELEELGEVSYNARSQEERPARR